MLSVSNCVFFEKKNTRLGTECTRLHPPLEKRGHVLVVPESTIYKRVLKNYLAITGSSGELRPSY